jgi:microcin C transport system substrate-binding protein
MRYLFLALLLFPSFAFAQALSDAHGIAMHGAPKYAADFTHFDYVNADAPKGGVMRLSGNETYDTFNQFTTKGVSAAGLNLLYVSLMEKAQDEPFTMYGALASGISVPEDRSWAEFTLRKNAVWSDGQPITAEDVVWTFNTLTTKAQPAYRAYYANVASVEALGDKRVKFTFDMAGNRELPLIVGEMTILPKHYWEDRDFEATTLDIPVSSGPYRIESFDQGRSLTYARVADWWGADLPVFKGRYNFDQIIYEYYRDQDVSLQAFFAGDYDYRREWTAKLWATGYDVPPVKNGEIVKKLVPNQLPQGMQGFVMNLRRPVFQDLAVRKAMNLAFDFEWSNKQFAYDAYERTDSYFENSEMQASGVPSGRALEILEPYRDQLPSRVFETAFEIPKTDGSGNNRAHLREAMKLLDEAGYVMGEDGVRVHKDSGTRLSFEFLVANTNGAFERWFGPYKKNLKRIGIDGTIRVVDASQYVNRVLAHDFDFIVHSWGQSNSPGNEQREYWGSERADLPGSRNMIGIKDPVVDALIEDIVKAPTREELVEHVRALDYVLLNGWYVVPNWHIAGWRIAYWDKFNQPETQAPYDLGVVDTWWQK